MTKNRMYVIGSIIIFLLAAASLVSMFAVQIAKSGSSIESRFKGTMGNTMYKFRSSLKAIAEDKTISDQRLEEIHARLLTSHAYAETLDFALSPGKPLLVPAVESMQQIVRYLQQQQEADPLNWTERYTEEHAKLLEFIDTMNYPLGRVYYEPDPQEDVRITLTIRNTEDMVIYNDALRDYVSSLK